ncbi:Rv3235 family protein [Streptomyces sp. NBC_01478]|uniref:Rv3235 family protein n=1 Tax=Streptomyces sp. NBC_01478 TaxID=2903882 RepID=UPI0032447031
MHKVMNRTAQPTPTRPPTRRDPRRPGTGSPRGQGGGTSSTTPAAEAPASAAPARHTDATTTPPTPTPSHRTNPTASTPVADRTAPRTSHAEPHTVPAQATQAARSRVPQPRPTDLFADRLLAVLSGQRPVHWMLRHTAGRAYDDLALLAEHSPLRATRGTRPVVRDIGYYVARPGAVEAFARIGAGDQVRAMAFRLERGADLRWRCTAVELGGPRAPRSDDD